MADQKGFVWNTINASEIGANENPALRRKYVQLPAIDLIKISRNQCDFLFYSGQCVIGLMFIK